MAGSIRIPAAVRRKAETSGAHDWLAGLPALVASLEADWAITVGTPFPDGTEAYVTEATQADGTPAVLKVMVPRGDGSLSRAEILTLRLAGGHGCVPLLRADPGREAMLVTRLGPSLSTLGLPYERRQEILCDLAAQVWRPAPGCDLPDGADKAARLSRFVAESWESLGRPCSERAVEHARACAERRRAAHDDERARLLHGDVHQWNALQAPGAPGGFALVDPDGLLAEPEYDLGVMLREDPADVLRYGPHERARWLAARSGLDAAAIWEWGVLERVSTGLVCTSIDLQPVGREMLRAADLIAAAPDRDI